MKCQLLMSEGSAMKSKHVQCSLYLNTWLFFTRVNLLDTIFILCNHCLNFYFYQSPDSTPPFLLDLQLSLLLRRAQSLKILILNITVDLGKYFISNH